MTLTASIVATPFGPMTVLSVAGVVHAAAFGDDVGALRGRLPRSIADLPLRERDSPPAAALRDYADGDVGALDAVPVEQPGGPFFTAVWREMRAIPAGATVSYGELAARAGAPRAVRAAGSACARNAACLFVPCHRVVARDGSLGGYYYGLALKERLLAHERRHHLATAVA